eukprot:TRINITY_DN10250_c0_g1_i1.p1 TRINITY_DN10250_c0_g1~~TRINITY_DN10250_c0_g1_i1.p1  ORF type:complete len:281 (-),score=79.42 TRINITY_DN10250_c0_g1_i1:582-1424(-)
MKLQVELDVKMVELLRTWSQEIRKMSADQTFFMTFNDTDIWIHSRLEDIEITNFYFQYWFCVKHCTKEYKIKSNENNAITFRVSDLHVFSQILSSFETEENTTIMLSLTRKDEKRFLKFTRVRKDDEVVVVSLCEIELGFSPKALPDPEEKYIFNFYVKRYVLDKFLEVAHEMGQEVRVKIVKRDDNVTLQLRTGKVKLRMNKLRIIKSKIDYDCRYENILPISLLKQLQRVIANYSTFILGVTINDEICLQDIKGDAIGMSYASSLFIIPKFIQGDDVE